MVQNNITDKIPHISTYQHTIVYRLLKKSRLLDRNGLLKVVFIELVMLLMWALVFLAASFDRVTWRSFNGTTWPKYSRVISIYDIPRDAKTPRPPMWIALLPQSPIPSLEEYEHIEMIDSIIPLKVPSNQYVLEIHRALNNRCVTKIDYTYHLNELIAEGNDVIGKSRIHGLTQSQINAVGSVKDGEYWVALYVNGIRCSNKASFFLDSNFDALDEPTLQLVPLEMGPGQSLPYVGVRAVGPKEKDPNLTNMAVPFSELIVNGVTRKPKTTLRMEQATPLRSMQQKISIHDISNYVPAIGSEQLRTVKLKIGKFESALYGLELPMVYDIPLYCLLFGAFPLILLSMSLFDIELNRFVQWVVREKRIDIKLDDFQELLDKLQCYYRSKWLSFLPFLIAIVVVCNWIIPEFTNQKWSWVSYITTGSWERPTIACGIAILYIILWDSIVFNCVLKFFGWTWLLFRLSRFPLKVDPIHPDSCGGFGPLNLVQKGIGYLIAGGGIYIISIVFNNHLFLGDSLFRNEHIALMITFIILAPLIFIFPLCFFRRKLWWAKREAITWVDTLANDTVAAIPPLLANTERTDYEKMLKAAAKLETVVFTGNYRERIMSMRALPFDFKTFKSFLTLAYTPFLSLIIPFLPETFQKIVSFFT